jgi:DNA replication protein DnaC
MENNKPNDFDMNPILKMFLAAKNRQMKCEPGDYYADNGFLICGKCNTPRQSMHLVEGHEVVFPIMCKCREEERDRMHLEMENNKRRERLLALRKKSLMDHRFHKTRFETFQETSQNARVLTICKRYVEKFDEMKKRNQGLLFYGNVGTGKTYAAACIANALLDSGVSVIMTSFVKILSQKVNFYDENDDELYENLRRVKLLIIDDLGAERGTDYALERIYHIIDTRYRAGLPIILTTNVSLNDMKSATDIRYVRIYDRIFESCYPVAFNWLSFRKQEANRRFLETQKLLEE